MIFKTILLLNFLSTFFMLGVIWFVQIVHYRVFNFVEEKIFPEFSLFHSSSTTYVVLVPMIIELLTSFMLIYLSPGNIPYSILLGGFFIVVLIWIITFLLLVPLHNKLNNRKDTYQISKLTRFNWFRTILWTVRGVIILIILIKYY